jgi:hypothetical protein
MLRLIVSFGLCNALVVFSELTPSDAAAQCAPDTLNCGDFDQKISSAPADQLTCDGYFGGGAAAYDMMTGRLSAGASGSDISYSAGARVSDRYRIIGIPPGTLLSIRAELQVTGSISTNCRFTSDAGGQVSASLSEAGGEEASYRSGRTCFNCECFDYGDPAEAVLAIPIMRTAASADEEFQLGIRLFTGAGNGHSSGTARLRFTGLPQGAAVVSCQGYRQEVPVPVLATTWSRIKAAYR